ncbi:MAG: acetyl-CoA carboxylase biotin carboxyl carrier protein, partial [Halobacteriovoraceae bacterium]|nr:acetyl-CoA carboxylase biotin carboxyl carrier protein [Halobacteriovoraceae bacterium]
LEKFIQIAKKEGVHELKYEANDEKYEVRLTTEKVITSVQPSNLSMPVSQNQGQERSSESNKNIVEITSPFVGTFYQSSSPESEPYVKLGDKISSGQVLCIIEAMKIMNEIESDVEGNIVEISCENENYVEYGQVLFKIKVK